MGQLHFQPSRSNLSAPEVVNGEPEASATISLGAPVARNSGDASKFEEHAGGATVTGIVGVAMQAVASGAPDFGTEMQVAKAGPNQEFLGQVYDSGGSAVATVAGDGTYLGNDYGMVEVSGDWYVDEDDTSDVVLTVTKELPEINAVLFKFISSAIED